MSKIDVLIALADKLGDLAYQADDAGKAAIALALWEAQDLVGDVIDAGIDPEDTAADQNELIRDIWQIVAAEGVAVIFTIGATAAVATVGSGGLVIAATAFLLAEATDSFLGFMADEWGITFVGRNIDYSGFQGPLEIIGTTASDTLTSTEQGDTVTLGWSSDTLFNIGGSDTVDGGRGTDTVSYQRMAVSGSAGIIVDARTTSGQYEVRHGSGTDQLTSVERIIGTSAADTFFVGNYGSNLAPGLFGGFLRDIEAGGGNDVIFLHNLGGQGPQQVNIEAGSGEEDALVVGDDGFNTTIDLAAGTARYQGGANASFRISGVEWIYGGDKGDTMIGNGWANRFEGFAGNDGLFGGGGTDLLIGGDGSDRLSGGADADRMYGGQGTDTYTAGAGDIVGDDAEGLGSVIFNGVTLRGRKDDDQTEDPRCPDDAPPEQNNADEDDDEWIEGKDGERYKFGDYGLIVELNGEQMTIEGWFEGALGIKLNPEDDPEEWAPPDCFGSPLVLDLNGNGIDLVNLGDSRAYFDIDNDGTSELTAWIAPTDGILAFDRNGDGLINDATELFGYGETFSGGGGRFTQVPGMEDGGRLTGPGGLDARYTSGFARLAELDFNADGAIDALDTFYTTLRVWRDLDGDGRSGADELFGLEESGVASIALDGVVRADRDIGDSIITDTGSYTGTDGMVREVSDVWFRFDQFDTRNDDRTGVTAEIAALPQLRGVGRLPDLHLAMARDGVLREMVAGLAAMDGSDLGAFRLGVEAMLFRWAGVEAVDPLDRGASADGRRLAVIEAVSDTDFRQWSGDNPRSIAGLLLEAQFTAILRNAMVKIAAQTDLGATAIAEISFEGGAFTRLEAGTVSTTMLDVIFDTAPTDWAARLAHVQAGVMMLDRVYKSFADVAAAGDNGLAYRADVVARMAEAGFGDISYYSLIDARMGTGGNDSILTPSVFVLLPVDLPTDLALTGAGDDEVKWGNKAQVLFWGPGQGNDEIDRDAFFALPQFAGRTITSEIRMMGINRTDITFSRGEGAGSNDLILTLTATGETLTFRNLLAATNLATTGLVFANGEVVALSGFEAVISALSETGTAGDDVLIQRTGTVIDGGAGDDILRGTGGDTDYVYGRGSGNDLIVEPLGQGGENRVIFGPGLTLADLDVIRPEGRAAGDLILRIRDTGEELRIQRQYDNDRVIVDLFVFDDGTVVTSDAFLAPGLENGAGDDRLVGSAADEYFGGASAGNDTLTGLRGDDIYVFAAGQGADRIEDFGLNVYSPAQTDQFYQREYLDKNRGDIVLFDFTFEQLTASRTGTILNFLDAVSGASLVVDNTQSMVARYAFLDSVGGFSRTVYTLPQIMDMIDAAVDATGGGVDDDLLNGDDTGNLIFGGDGRDTINGGAGRDTLYGDAGDDLIDVGDREDTNGLPRSPNLVYGGDGNDRIVAGWDRDTIFGGAGDDVIDASYGDETITGGTGNDTIINLGGIGLYQYALGDGDDLILGEHDVFSPMNLSFGPGISLADISFDLVQINAAALTSYYGFSTDDWGLRATLAQGGSVTMVGAFGGQNLSGVGSLLFNGAAAVTVQSVLNGMFAPSDADQIIVDHQDSRSFAPGGGDDRIYLRSGNDTLSIGLNDGDDVVIGRGQSLSVFFEGGIAPSSVQIERFGAEYESLRLTLADGTTLTIEEFARYEQDFNTGDLSQGIYLDRLRFADGTVLTAANILAADLTGGGLLTGSMVDDTMIGSAGSDTLRGGGGSDTYRFGIGSGSDVVIEGPGNLIYGLVAGELQQAVDVSAFRQTDSLIFGPGVTVDDLTLVRSGAGLEDLVITLASGDSLTIQGQFAQGNWGSVIDASGEVGLVTLERWRAIEYGFWNGAIGIEIDPEEGWATNPDRPWGDLPLVAPGLERFVFADGTVLDRAAIAALLDSVANGGNDALTSGPMGATLDGGAGNDTLTGGTGNDQFVFGLGYDTDRITDAGGADVIGFAAGLEAGRLTLTRTGADLNDLLIEVDGQARTALEIIGQFAGDGREVEVFRFAGVPDLTAQDVRLSLLSRSMSNGSDSVTGFEVDDMIHGRDGDDRIEGRGGDDIISGGDGWDTAVFRGPRENYRVEQTGSRIIVTDLTGRDGTDVLDGVEVLEFVETGAPPVRIDLATNAAPVAPGVTLAGREDTALQITAADLLAGTSDPDGAAPRLVSVGMVAGGVLVALPGGGWQFRPDADRTVDAGFDYTVEDAGGLQSTGRVTITLAPVNDAPQALLALPDVAVAEDSAVDILLPAGLFADADGDVLVLSAERADGGPLPVWLTFDPATGRLSGQPPADFNGDVLIVVRAADGSEAASASFTLSVTAQNDAPTTDDAPVQRDLLAGRTTNVNLPAFSDADGDELTLTVTLQDGSALPDWITLAPQGGALAVTPPPGFNGTLLLRVVASDGTATADWPLTLTIAPPGNTAPVLAAPLAPQLVQEDGAVDFALPPGAFVDADGDVLSLTARLADGSALPGWLSFDAATGRFTGQPPQDLNGALEIVVTASDGRASADAGFTLTIAAVNDAPDAAADGGYTVAAGQSLTITAASLLANDSDRDGDTLSIVAVGTAKGGSVVLDAAGNVVFTASTGASSAGFTYTLSDGTVTATAQVALTVTGSNPWQGYVLGTSGNDWLIGRLFAENRIFGAGGNDRITGGLFDDHLAGGDGNDIVFGGISGNNRLDGNAGNDKLIGGVTTDVMDGGSGNDSLTGSAGADVFVFRDGGGRDRVTDFRADGPVSQVDRIGLDVAGIDTVATALAHAQQVGQHVRFTFDDGEVLTLEHTSLASLGQENFVFL